MSTNKAIRADDASGLSIATVQLTEDAISKDFQAIVLNDPTTAANKATVTGSGALKVDNSGVTQPVSIAGTVNVRPSDGTNPITSNFDVDSGAGTQYVLGFSLRKSASGGSVEYGTSTDPVKVDPTGTTAQPITDNSGSLTVDAPVGTPVAVRLSDGSAFLTTASGALKVDGSAVTQPVSGTVTTTPPSNASTNVAQLAGTATSVNSGTKDAGTLRVVIATDQPQLTNKLLVTPDALPANQSVNMAQVAGTTTDTNSGNKSAGTQRVVLATDQPALTTAMPVNATPATTGGLTIKHLVSAASTNATNVKASAGQVYGWCIFNTNAATRYVKLHNNAGTPTAGTAIVQTISVPPSGGSNFSCAQGIAFGTGIAFTTVTGTADSDATAVAANDLTIDIFYA